MRLNDALQRYIAAHELTDESIAKLRYRLNCWRRCAPEDEPSADAFDAFRRAALDAQLSRRTIEETVRDVARIAGVADLGRTLRGWKTAACKAVPTLQTLSTAYERAGVAQWPVGPSCRTLALMHVGNAEWWRAFLVFSFFTGLRLRDLRSVTWAEWDRQRWTASKTGKLHQYPASEIVDRHLQPLRVSGAERIFAFSQSQERLVRRELKRIADDDGLTPQAVRRASITGWSIASPDAGRLIHGVDLGVLRHYLDVRRVLEAALPRLEWPTAFLLPAERDQRQQATARILQLASRLPPERLDDLERVATAFAG